MIFDKCDPIPCSNSNEHKAIQDFAEQVVIVIQSCNENEYYASLELMEAPNIPKPDSQSQLFKRAVLLQNEDNMTIAVGMFADRKAAIAWTKQGTDCEKGIQSVCILFPNIRAILGVGVAFGMKRSEVNFCDVLVATQIADLGRIRLEDERVVTEGRGGDITSTKTSLSNIFCQDVTQWKFPCTDTSRQAKAVPSLLVSGSFLLDGHRVKLSLQEQYKSAKGGEMEGWILYTHILKDHPNLAAIIIKGVADYGDGTKDKRWQLTAAMAAASYTYFKLKRSAAFRGMSTVYLLS